MLTEKKYIVFELDKAQRGMARMPSLCKGGGMQLSAPEQKAEKEERGSIIIVIGTNIPANGHQLARIAKRAAAAA